MDFERTCFKFNVCQFIYVPNWQYDRFERETDQPGMETLFYEEGYINMYFASSVRSGGDTVGGYAWFPGGPDIVLIRKANITTKTISHELGHFFGLYHTFEDGFGLETVDGTNCTVAGDLICDTEADDQDAEVDPTNCNMTNNLTDPNGAYLLVPSNNIMSYHPDMCRTLFTPGQASRMIWNYLNNRSYLR